MNSSVLVSPIEKRTGRKKKVAWEIKKMKVTRMSPFFYLSFFSFPCYLFTVSLLGAIRIENRMNFYYFYCQAEFFSRKTKTDNPEWIVFVLEKDGGNIIDKIIFLLLLSLRSLHRVFHV